MKKYALLCVLLAVVTVFAACSSPEPQPPAGKTPPPVGKNLPKPAPTAPAATPAPSPAAAPAAAAPAAAPAPAVAPTPDGAAQPAAAAPAAGASLVGSTWKIGEFVATFKDDTTVSLKGGALASVAPNGLDGKYSLKDGKFEVSAMGMTKTGTFDGTTLVVDGTTAVKQ